MYEPARFMTVAVAAKQLIESIQQLTDSADEAILSQDSLCVGLARVGSSTQQIKSGTLAAIADTDLGEPLHCLVIPGELHDLEAKMMSLFK